jgi:hypothetical protein
VTSVGSSGGTSPEPGLDLHEWETTWALIEEGRADDPDAALSQFADLVHRMLVASGYQVDDPVEREGEEREVVATYLAARETAERAEVGAASRGDVELAIDDLRTIFESLTAERE